MEFPALAQVLSGLLCWPTCAINPVRTSYFNKLQAQVPIPPPTAAYLRQWGKR